MCKASTRFEISTALPDGANLVRIEQGGESVLLVRAGQRISPGFIRELNNHLAHATRDSGTTAR